MTTPVPDAAWDEILAAFGDQPIRALTVWQPWASAIAAAETVLAAKTTENRGWRIPPGPLTIHAGKQLDESACRLPLVRQVLRDAGWRRIGDLPRGALVAVVRVTGSHRPGRNCCSWGQLDQWHNDLAAVKALPKPIPMRGKQKLWTVPRPAQPITAGAVAAAIRAHRYHHAHEDGLQEGIMQALTAAGIPAEREVRLAPRDRVDVLSGGVGVEVKVAGSPESVLAQLQRYATHDRITALVLVTTRSRHRAMPETVGGKPLEVIYLGGTG